MGDRYPPNFPNSQPQPQNFPSGYNCSPYYPPGMNAGPPNYNCTPTGNGQGGPIYNVRFGGGQKR
ncbi:hypothetical protein M569_11307 [Genlisea aurea]|uniref:Uncharacterized protein n=1 Tax=Genlisea aurea TaxID=192259 RepID=S8C9L0_9LAMI|nr:hypothetical protein M569_11307 [Genlisea aurea]